MSRTKQTLLAVFLACYPLLSQASGWKCQPDVEVQCTTNACSVLPDAGGIPIGLSFDSRGNFSLCAYSGCWESKGEVVSASPFLVIASARVDWSGPNAKAEDREDILIAFSPGDHVAMVKAGSLALPMRCSEEATSRDGA